MKLSSNGVAKQKWYVNLDQQKGFVNWSQMTQTRKALGWVCKEGDIKLTAIVQKAERAAPE
jgi:hypothetical protein